jgi:hypothetical protein
MEAGISELRAKCLKTMAVTVCFEFGKAFTWPGGDAASTDPDAMHSAALARVASGAKRIGRIHS